MDTKHSSGRLLRSLVAAAAFNLVRFSPDIALIIDRLVEKLSRLMPEWAAQVAFFVFTAAVIFLIAISPLGVWLGKHWLRIERRLARGFAALFRSQPRYVYEERTTGEFRRDVALALSRTKIVYGLSSSTHSLVTEVIDELLRRDLESVKGIDIRFLFLDPASPYWRGAMRGAAEMTSVDVERLRHRHENVIRRLSLAIPHVKIAYHSQSLNWWLLILDDRLYVAHYGMRSPDPGVSRMPVIGFPRSHPMYSWLADEYARVAPPTWHGGLFGRHRSGGIDYGC